MPSLAIVRAPFVAAGLLAVTLPACGGDASEPATGSESEPATGGESLPPLLPLRAEVDDCRLPIPDCEPAGCAIVHTYEHLEASGCVRATSMPACARSSVARDAVTGALGPDGACWTFLDSRIPSDYTASRDCDRLIAEAPQCSP